MRHSQPQRTIPVNRPVNGADLDKVREKLGVPVAEFIMVLGLPMKTWGELMQTPEKVVPVTAALLARFFDAYPERYPIPLRPTAAQVFDKMQDVIGGEVSHSQLQRWLGVSVGREGTAGYRYLAQHTGQAQVVQFILLAMMEMMEAEGREGWDVWSGLVHAEASARGSEDIWQTGKWNKMSRPPTRKLS